MKRIEDEHSGPGQLNNEESIGELRRLLHAMEGGLDKFGKEFMLEDFGLLRKRYSTSRLAATLETFVRHSAKISALSRWSAKLMKMDKHVQED